MANKAYLSFKTRYKLTTIDSVTGLPKSKPVVVENLVLNSGLTLLGEAVAYNKISIGTSGLKASIEQTGLVTRVSDALIAGTPATHRIDQVGDEIIATITHSVQFKNIQFPADSREIDIREVGIGGMTRAVLEEPLTIGMKDWVQVDATLEYNYGSAKALDPIYVHVNGAQTNDEVVTATLTPFIASRPYNANGRGWGGKGRVTCFLWDGLPVGEQMLTLLVNDVDLVATQDIENHSWNFKLTGTDTALAKVKGVVIRDTIIGGGYLIEFKDGLKFEEDDIVELNFQFKWGRA